MDEKDREIQELRRQVESLKAEVVKRGKWIEFKRTYLECRCSFAAGRSLRNRISARTAARTCTSWRGCK